MRRGDCTALPDASQVEDACEFVTGIAGDPDGISYRSLEMSGNSIVGANVGSVSPVSRQCFQLPHIY